MMIGHCCHCETNCFGCLGAVPTEWECVIGTVSTSKALSGTITTQHPPPFNTTESVYEWSFPDLTLYGTHSLTQDSSYAGTCDWRWEQGHTREIRQRLGTAGGQVVSGYTAFGPTNLQTDPGTADATCGTGTPTWECGRVSRAVRVYLDVFDNAGTLTWRVILGIDLFSRGTRMTVATGNYLSCHSHTHKIGGNLTQLGASHATVLNPPWFEGTVTQPQIVYTKAVACATDLNGTPFTMNFDSGVSTTTFGLSYPSTITLAYVA